MSVDVTMHLFRCRKCRAALAYPGLCLICRETPKQRKRRTP